MTKFASLVAAIALTISPVAVLAGGGSPHPGPHPGFPHGPVGGGGGGSHWDHDHDWDHHGWGYSHEHHWWHGRYWEYGIGSCWRPIPGGYVWVCGD